MDDLETRQSILRATDGLAVSGLKLAMEPSQFAKVATWLYGEDGVKLVEEALAGSGTGNAACGSLVLQHKFSFDLPKGLLVGTLAKYLAQVFNVASQHGDLSGDDLFKGILPFIRMVAWIVQDTGTTTSDLSTLSCLVYYTGSKIVGKGSIPIDVFLWHYENDVAANDFIKAFPRGVSSEDFSITDSLWSVQRDQLYSTSSLKIIEKHLVAMLVAVLVSSPQEVRIDCLDDFLVAIGQMVDDLDDNNDFTHAQAHDSELDSDLDSVSV